MRKSNKNKIIVTLKFVAALSVAVGLVIGLGILRFHAARLAYYLESVNQSIQKYSDEEVMLRQELSALVAPIRIYVNNETEELERVIMTLSKIEYEALIIFVSYHSLEDRIIKHSFRQWQSEDRGRILTRHPLTPSDSEIEINYKARSAKLRAFLTINYNAKFLI